MSSLKSYLGANIDSASLSFPKSSLNLSVVLLKYKAITKTFVPSDNPKSLDSPSMNSSSVTKPIENVSRTKPPLRASRENYSKLVSPNKFRIKLVSSSKHQDGLVHNTLDEELKAIKASIRDCQSSYMKTLESAQLLNQKRSGRCFRVNKFKPREEATPSLNTLEDVSIPTISDLSTLEQDFESTHSKSFNLDVPRPILKNLDKKYPKSLVDKALFDEKDELSPKKRVRFIQ